MTEEAKQDNKDNDEKGARQKVGDGIRSGIGVLSAFKDALEEAIQEARDRGDLSTDRAKEVVKEALNKAQAAASGARERLDFVTHTELEELAAAVAALGDRVAALESSLSQAPGGGAQEEEVPPQS